MENELSAPVWEKMANLSLDMFCTINQYGTFIHVGDASRIILGYDNQDLIGSHFTKFLHPEYLTVTQNAFQEIINGTKTNNFENCYIHKNGKVVPILWSAVWSDEDKAMFCVARDITERKINQCKLEESEQRYRTLFENNSDLIYLENKEGLVTEVNQSFCRFFNLPKEKVVNFPASVFLPAEMVAVGEESLQKALMGQKQRFELVLKNPRKEPKIFEAIKYPLIVNGEVIGVQTIAKDITPLVSSVQTIQQQANKLHSIFESITDGFLMLDKNWKFTYINQEAERLMLLDKSQCIGKNIWEEFPSEVNGTFYQQCHQAVETGEPVQFEAQLQCTQKWYLVKAFPSSEGLSVYFTDITEKVRARQELEKLSLVASKTNNGVLIADKDWNIEWINNGFTRLYGYNPEEALGKKPAELLHNFKTDVTVYQSLEDKLLSGEPVSYEILNMKKNGEEVWVSLEITPIFDEKGEIWRFIDVETDITALKNSELELARLAKDLYRQNKDLQQFTYIVSHNLRAPVANALGMAELLTLVDKTSEVYELSLSNLKECILQLDAVLKDMNTILSIRDSKGNLEHEKIEIKSVIQQVISSLQEPLQKCGGEVIFELADGFSLRANKAYLYSIFYNLLSNAIKYRSDERVLKVRIKCYGNSKKGALISFSDNGSGFDLQKAKNNIFKLYKRFHLSKNGRGIGLYLVKAHLEAMGGCIEVTSQKGLGTRFLIYLPNL